MNIYSYIATESKSSIKFNNSRITVACTEDDTNMGPILDSHCHRFPHLSNREQIGWLTDVRRYSSPIPLSIGIINSFRVKKFSLVFRPPFESEDAHGDKVKKNFQGNQNMQGIIVYCVAFTVFHRLLQYKNDIRIFSLLYFPYFALWYNYKFNFSFSLWFNSCMYKFGYAFLFSFVFLLEEKKMQIISATQRSW